MLRTAATAPEADVGGDAPRLVVVFDFLSADGNHLVHGAIADNLPHYGFRNIAEGSPRLPNVEKEFNGIRDAVLNHPLHQCGVQVTRHHLRFLLRVAGNLIRIDGACGREPEFLRQLPFDRNDCCHINAQRQLKMCKRGFTMFDVPSDLQ